jgi:protein-tyrosine-phosphatase
MPTKTVLFVCLHGAAKSVLAAADFERLARERGLDARAESAGTEPDAEIAPRVLAELRAEGVDLHGRHPRRVTRADVERAWRVVAFACDLGELAAAGPRVEQWEVPAVGEDFGKARAAIDARLARLLDELSA